jgi:hypothetical protein
MAALLASPFLLIGCGHLHASSQRQVPKPADASGAPAAPRGSATAPVTIEGTLVDTRCYSIDQAHRAVDHKTADGTIEACAQACARLGIPVGLLTAGGEIAILIAPSHDFENHMGRTARATGVPVFGGAALRPDSISVKGTDGGWAKLELHQMM